MGKGILLSVALALAEAWLGIALAFSTDWPSSFWITALSAGAYLLAALPRPAWTRQDIAGVRPRSVVSRR